MSGGSLRKATPVAFILVMGLALSTSGAMPSAASDSPKDLYSPVPKAECGENDRPEPALQGQVPAHERRLFQGYSCNLEFVGQFAGEGASWQHAWYEDCAYYDTANREDQEHRGTVVVDASDPTKPQVTAYLDEPAMLDPWESLKVHKRRGLLAGVEMGGPGFSIYDLKQECTKPKLLASITVPEVSGHAGNFATDGTTYYGAEINGDIYAIDIRNPKRPRPLATFAPPGGVHDLSTNKSGTRLYVADSARIQGVGSAVNGLVIMDVSQIDARGKNPKPKVISKLYWNDGGIAQMTQRVTIAGKPYILFVDENGSGGLQGWEQACAAGLPPFGFARLIDISNEKKPKIASRLMLETHDPANCPFVLPDTKDAVIFIYDSHYCGVDRPNNARLVACGYFESGLRIFDVRDPKNPKEIAYYNPAPMLGYRPGSDYNATGYGTSVDWAASTPRIHLQRGEVWFTSHQNAFQIVRFTKPLRELLK